MAEDEPRQSSTDAFLLGCKGALSLVLAAYARNIRQPLLDDLAASELHAESLEAMLSAVQRERNALAAENAELTKAVETYRAQRDVARDQLRKEGT